MKRAIINVATVVVCALALSLNAVQAQMQQKEAGSARNSSAKEPEIEVTKLMAQARPSRRTGFSLMPAGRVANLGGPLFRLTPLAAAPNSILSGSCPAAGLIDPTTSWFKSAYGAVQATSASRPLVEVAHDGTLTGNGTAGSPLGVSLPLILSGAFPRDPVSFANGIIRVTNTGLFGSAVEAEGGPRGDGVVAQGGSNEFGGGDGVHAFGGSSTGGTGGDGALAFGGNSFNGNGGLGLVVRGGQGTGVGNIGGDGISVQGGAGANGAIAGLAGRFIGDVVVTGTLSKGGGSFKIDHPLDPENKYLYHSFVESPDMMNVYNGNVTTDKNGEATVTFPEYFEALNRDFRYQLTVIGTFAQAIVADEIKGNRFVIRTSVPGVKVSWQVTGIRRDAWANKNRIQVEEEKPEKERGYYLHPEAFNQPEEKGVRWACEREGMRQLRLEAERMRTQQK